MIVQPAVTAHAGLKVRMSRSVDAPFVKHCRPRGKSPSSKGLLWKAATRGCESHGGRQRRLGAPVW